MVQHEGVKTMKIFKLSFCMSNQKSRLPKKYEVEGPNKHSPNQFMAYQNLLYNFIKWIYIVIFSPRSSVLRLISKSPQHYIKPRLQWIPLHKILNRKIIIIHFQNRIFGTETRLQKEFSKTIKNRNLVRFCLSSKFLPH